MSYEFQGLVVRVVAREDRVHISKPDQVITLTLAEWNAVRMEIAAQLAQQSGHARA